MIKILQDKYILGQSNNKGTVNIAGEIKLDLQLESNPNSVNDGNIHGIVKDVNGTPIENATIKLMTTDYHPLMHTITSANGEYSIENIIPNNSYNVFAVANGFKLKQGNEFSIGNNQSIEINFILELDPSTNNSIISGSLIDAILNKPLVGGILSLFKINNDNSETLKGRTYSNSNGNFAFRDIEIGKYKINATSLGYESNSAIVSLSKPQELINIKIGLTSKDNFLRGTVSGYIKDSKKLPINNADVILYKVNEDNTLMPVAFTRTIESGFYLFSNVPNGDYKIKSSDFESVTVDFPNPWTFSPYFHKFTVQSSDKTYTKVYNATDVILYGAAKVEAGLIKNVGSLLGYIILDNVDVPSAGNYNFIINYVTPDKNRVCNISVNNKSLDELIGFEETDSLNLTSAKDKVVVLSLQNGTNIIKIYNN